MPSVLPIFPFSKEKSLQNQNQQKNNRKFPMKLNKSTQALTLQQATCTSLPTSLVPSLTFC